MSPVQPPVQTPSLNPFEDPEDQPSSVSEFHVPDQNGSTTPPEVHPDTKLQSLQSATQEVLDTERKYPVCRYHRSHY
jgi:hypothetical protein